ncbi:MAG: SDR family NAD(P)-dependent oxidoreductase [Actinomycetota bacterium]
MRNAFDQPQTILVLGGRSEIGRAIVRALDSPNLRRVVLARRPGDDGDDEQTDGLSGGVEVSTVDFDATDHARHAELIEAVAAQVGDLDVIVQAFGQLGSDVNDAGVAAEPAAAAELVHANTVGAVSSGLAAATRLRAQGHGTLVVVSSVAGVRTRPSNFVYGSSKAGQDAFATGLGHALAGSGASVLVVRPGFVRSQMTDGMDPAPFACDPDDVGSAVVSGLRSGRSVVYAPGILRWVVAAMRLVPGSLWRRLDR